MSRLNCTSTLPAVLGTLDALTVACDPASEQVEALETTVHRDGSIEAPPNESRRLSRGAASAGAASSSAERNDFRCSIFRCVLEQLRL
jgi:hypothetical protein